MRHSPEPHCDYCTPYIHPIPFPSSRVHAIGPLHTDGHALLLLRPCGTLRQTPSYFPGWCEYICCRLRFVLFTMRRYMRLWAAFGVSWPWVLMHAVACLDSGLLWAAVSSNAQDLHYERIIQTCFQYLHREEGKTSLNLLIGQQSHCTAFIQCPAVKKFTPCLGWHSAN